MLGRTCSRGKLGADEALISSEIATLAGLRSLLNEPHDPSLLQAASLGRISHPHSPQTITYLFERYVIQFLLIPRPAFIYHGSKSNRHLKRSLRAGYMF